MLLVLASGCRRRLLRSFLLAATLLGGCSAHWYPYTAEDTVCLNKQVYSNHLPTGRAVSACGTSVPDLTGDENLQQVAMNAGVKFRVDPALDRGPTAAGGTVIQPVAHFTPLY